jgi:ABC-2 type transport system permease protein
MNTPSNSMDEVGTHVPAPDVANIPARTLLYWSIRREIWENRSVYIAPLATAILFLFACLIATAHMGVNFFDVNLSDSDGAPRGHLINALTAVTCMVFVVSVIVGFFYSLDSLYGERRDRSILFWKSLPVSDLITVIAKIVVPLVILPALAFAVIVVAQFVMMLLGSAVLAAHGQSVGDMWSAASIVQSWLVLLYCWCRPGRSASRFSGRFCSPWRFALLRASDLAARIWEGCWCSALPERQRSPLTLTWIR